MGIITTFLKSFLKCNPTPEMILAAVGAMEDDLEQILASALDKAAERRRFADRERKRALRSGAREFVFERDGERCVYCGDEDGPFHIDHVIPISRGGASTPENLVVACLTCNVSKGDKTPEEWRQ